MTARNLLPAMYLTTGIICAAVAVEAADLLPPMDSYLCEGYGLVRMGFVSGGVHVVIDGRAVWLPYLEERPGETYLYANDSIAMLLIEDGALLGPRVDLDGTIVLPTNECVYQSEAQP